MSAVSSGEGLMAFSVQQPLAWLVVHGLADCVNRSPRPINPDLAFRGPCLIHAPLRFDQSLFERIKVIRPDIDLPCREALPVGGIVGQAIIDDVVFEHPGEWFTGPYAFLVTGGSPLPFRACRGDLGFFMPSFAAARGAQLSLF